MDTKKQLILQQNKTCVPVHATHKGCASRRLLVLQEDKDYAKASVLTDNGGWQVSDSDQTTASVCCSVSNHVAMSGASWVPPCPVYPAANAMQGMVHKSERNYFSESELAVSGQTGLYMLNKC